MSYSESNGQVILTMSKEEYNRVLQVFAVATAQIMTRHGSADGLFELLNHLNRGNPHYTPYQVEAKKS